MVKLHFIANCFVTSATQLEHYPSLKNAKGELLPEIAVVGRSNVGKSSLINHLFGRKGLARTSSTPGKTQLLNFFCVDQSVIFTDLPGYGFAKVPIDIRKLWGPMIQQYLECRESLTTLLFLFDIRRQPNEEDIQLAEWIAAAGKKMILIFTKVDKVSSAERVKNSLIIQKQFPEHTIYDSIAYSSSKNIGRRELIAAIERTI